MLKRKIRKTLRREKEWKEATESIDWSKLGDNIKSFFGTDEKKEDAGDDAKKEDKEEIKKEESKDSKKDDKETKKEKEKDTKKEKKDEPKKPKIESVKVDLQIDGTRNDLELLDGASFNSSKAKLDALTQADLDRIAIETALNELQSFSFDLNDKVEEDAEFQSASTSEERESVAAECKKVSEWLDEETGMFTPVNEFTDKLKLLKELSAPIMARVREHNERPEALEALKQSINSSTVFLEKSKEYLIKPKPKEPKDKIVEGQSNGDGKQSDDPNVNKSEKSKEGAEENSKESDGPSKSTKSKVLEEDGLFKEKELDGLRKKIADVEKWRDEKLAEQESTPLSEMPKLTVSMIKSKIQDLDSEVQFLIQKARMLKAEKEREKRKLEAEQKKAEEERLKKEKKAKKKAEKEANSTDSEGEKKAEEETTEQPTGADDNTTEKKPEPEPIEEINNEGDTKDSDSDEPSEIPTEHVEL